MRLTLLAAALAASTVPQPGHAGPQAATVISGFASPESVLFAGDRAYVSNIGVALDPLAHDGDGFISLLAADGTVLERHAFPADGSSLDAPKGMALAGGTLYVADIDRIVGFDAASRVRRPDIPLPPGGPAFANDIAAEAGGTLLVTDTLRNAVYRLAPDTGHWTLLTDAVPGANGIAIDPATGTATIVGLGAGMSGGDVYTLTGTNARTNTGTPHRLKGAPHGLLDGIAISPDGTRLVSDWVSFDPPVPGHIIAIAPDGHTTPLETPALQGLADFSLAPDGRLWIPSIPTNTVVIVPAGG